MVASRAPEGPPHVGGAGDFRAVFDREVDYVWTSLRRLGVYASDLEDVTQARPRP